MRHSINAGLELGHCLSHFTNVNATLAFKAKGQYLLTLQVADTVFWNVQSKTFVYANSATWPLKKKPRKNRACDSNTAMPQRWARDRGLPPLLQ